MKKCLISLGVVQALLGGFGQGVPNREVMSASYHSIWNADVQAKVDADIVRYRMADAEAEVDASDGTEVRVEQMDHAFYFGAHIFNYNQLGSGARNRKYRELYGTLFNSATVAFYWRTLEPRPGAVRFEERYEDTEEYWNAQREPWRRPHWRRPPPDPVIEFLKTRRVRIHGHPLVWGDLNWHYPSWIFDCLCPESEKRALEASAGMPFPSRGLDEHVGQRMSGWRDAWRASCAQIGRKMDAGRISKLAPKYVARMNAAYARRVAEIAHRYGDAVDSWDVVNESSADFNPAVGSVSGADLQLTRYGFMPGDYAYRAFIWAQTNFPSSVWLNINDYAGDDRFVAQVKDLESHGARIDVIGSQMHLFDPKDAEAIAAGRFGTNAWQRLMAVARPEDVYRKFSRLASLGRPIHLSEVTITAGEGNSARGQDIQANILYDLYRIWFSIPEMNGITWWNVVDGCGAPDEPSYSGLFTRDMKPKPAYFALERLINHEWKTSLRTAVKNGKVQFRGFKGRYRLIWKNGEKLMEVR